MTRTSGKRAHLIAERLGQDNADRLSQLVGGTRLHVPGQLRNAGRLRNLLGDHLATLVVLHFGDGLLYVHRPSRSKSVDIRAVVRLSKRSLPVAQIARRLGCSERTVHAKRAQARTLGLLKGIVEE